MLAAFRSLVLERIYEVIRSHPTTVGIVAAIESFLTQLLHAATGVLTETLVLVNAVIALVTSIIALRVKLREMKRTEAAREDA